MDSHSVLPDGFLGRGPPAHPHIQRTQALPFICLPTRCFFASGWLCMARQQQPYMRIATTKPAIARKAAAARWHARRSRVQATVPSHQQTLDAAERVFSKRMVPGWCWYTPHTAVGERGGRFESLLCTHAEPSPDMTISSTQPKDCGLDSIPPCAHMPSSSLGRLTVFLCSEPIWQ